MTNTRPQKPTEKAVRQSRISNLASADNIDVCESLVAELQARRARLQQLLHLVWLEAERVPARRALLRTSAKCSNMRTKRTA